MNNWDDVRFFLEVARCGNVTSASQALGVNHSTVSRRVRSLEDKYGVRLFERIPSGYELTESGGEVFDLALELEQHNLRFARKLQGQDSRLSGKVSITMPHDIFEYFIVNQLKKFYEQYPNIVLDVQIAKGLKNLSAREADIAIRITPSPPDYLVGREIVRMQHGLYRAKNTEFRTQSPIIVWKENTDMPPWANEYLKSPDIALQVDDLLGMYSAVQAGIGIARMPVYMHNMKKSPDVELMEPELPPSHWGLWILSHIDLRRTARVQLVKDFLYRVLSENSGLFNDSKMFNREKT